MEYEKPKISVVVPVYNSDDTIGCCIESVLRQSFSDIELILVNDGSQDRSGRICDEYAAIDKRISVIHQANKGRSAARAAGVAAAIGQWSSFVDADDKLFPDSLSRLFEKADKETDIVLGNGFTLPCGQRKKIPIEDFRHMAVRAEGNIGVPWGSLYRRSIVTPYAFELPRDIMNGEDYIFWLRIVFHTEKPVSVVYENVYDKGEAHTSNCFVWTADYSYRLNEYRKSSIPVAVRDAYWGDMLADRLVNLYSVAVYTPKNEWIRSPFYREIMEDMSMLGIRLPFKKRLFLKLPGRMWRKGYSRIGETLKRIFIK